MRRKLNGEHGLRLARAEVEGMSVVALQSCYRHVLQSYYRHVEKSGIKGLQ